LSIQGNNIVGQELSINLGVNGLENIDPNNIIWYRGTTPVGTGASYIVGVGDVESEIVLRVVIGGQTIAVSSGGVAQQINLSGSLDSDFNINVDNGFSSI
jgi:hypothetical protein